MLRRMMLALLAATPFAKALAAEAEERKARSVARLRAENVPLIEHLPTIETGVESRRRTEIEVVKRTVALMIVAVKGESGDHALGAELIRSFAAEGFFTPDEQAFLDDPTPTDQQLVAFSWRYECVFVMLWALGIYTDLSRPDFACDASQLGIAIRDLGTAGLLNKANLRPQSELLDAADLIYRYHWATVDALINGRPTPAGLNGGVVYERHYSLNWLIGYQDQAWDDISTDT